MKICYKTDNLCLFIWIVLIYAVLLHRDFFIVLDLRLTKIGSMP